MQQLEEAAREQLLSAGAAPAAVGGFEAALQACALADRPGRESLAEDARKAEAVYRAAEKLLAAWPAKPLRDDLQATAAATVKEVVRRTRNAFAHAYARPVYEQVTDGCRRFVRAEELVYQVANLCPGLCPTAEEVQAELGVRLADKEGIEIAQTDFLSHVLSCRETGSHLVHAMLQPLPESAQYLEKFRRDGQLDLGTAQVVRQGALGCVYFNNVSYLNAEDDFTKIPLEIAVDLVLLDDDLKLGMLRGNRVEHTKYRGRRIFSSGLNLSHLYQGKLPLMFYITRDMGFVNKLYRGIAGECYDPDGPEDTLEKLWVGIVEGFAIGGGCQILLVLDYVIAERGAYCNLPARKEGIVPGVSPMRLARFIGERQAQAGVLFDKGFPVDSPEGAALVNEVLPAEEIDAAIDRLAADAAKSGVVSAGANRKAIRIGDEPLDLFRRYMALYSRVQGDCHFSPALVANLERYWVGRDQPPSRPGPA